MHDKKGLPEKRKHISTSEIHIFNSYESYPILSVYYLNKFKIFNFHWHHETLQTSPSYN